MSLDYDFNAADLDEFLVEYVDGTMDPVVQEAFEEFLRVYPEVAEQVDCLATVRSQLCRLGDKCRCHAPPGFQDRLKEHLVEESTKELSGIGGSWVLHLNTFALAFSFALLALAVAITASSPSPESGDSAVAAEVVGDVTAPLEDVRLRTAPIGHVLDFDNSVAISRNAYWKVSHTRPSQGEFYVEAAFERPVLLSVRRDAVTMQPVSTRASVAYTRR